MSDARELLNQNISESEFQAALVRDAQRFGWKVAHFRPAQDREGNWKTPLQGDPGFVDLVLVHEGLGQIIFAELKSDRPGARASLAQQQWARALNGAAAVINSQEYRYPRVGVPGVYYALWRPADQLFIDAVITAALGARNE